jgi:uroporphyrinogen-III synthase
MGGQPLRGRSIVVTRPAGQADSLCAALAALGAEPLRFPLLTISPVADPAPLEAVARRLAEFELAFFVSPNAVNFALDVMLPVAPWPAELRVATVGKGSEAALAARGFTRVIAPQSGFDSESVLALPAFQAPALTGRRVLILRGDGGRDLLGDTLSARGAIVEYIT